ncbi:hypothetical protein [Rhizobium sp. CC-YZS058]|uniref:hypothetical protein n=1 Tax=Rhizobium sp. CC-YZS058 TaxID=3042153 RepID=UPI002B05199B|nr:hypothetical protein [Rhizobium sp. CC-YZS058]MEA3533208.1 hypothetical protein [Rhizobium sp. CC-YZS058]
MSDKSANTSSDAARTGPSADQDRDALAKKAEAHHQDLKKGGAVSDDALSATGAFEK